MNYNTWTTQISPQHYQLKTWFEWKQEGNFQLNPQHGKWLRNDKMRKTPTTIATERQQRKNVYRMRGEAAKKVGWVRVVWALGVLRVFFSLARLFGNKENKCSMRNYCVRWNCHKFRCCCCFYWFFIAFGVSRVLPFPSVFVYIQAIRSIHHYSVSGKLLYKIGGKCWWIVWFNHYIQYLHTPIPYGMRVLAHMDTYKRGHTAIDAKIWKTATVVATSLLEAIEHVIRWFLLKSNKIVFKFVCDQNQEMWEIGWKNA